MWIVAFTVYLFTVHSTSILLPWKNLYPSLLEPHLQQNWLPVSLNSVCVLFTMWIGDKFVKASTNNRNYLSLLLCPNLHKLVVVVNCTNPFSPAQSTCCYSKANPPPPCLKSLLLSRLATPWKLPDVPLPLNMNQHVWAPCCLIGGNHIHFTDLNVSSCVNVSWGRLGVFYHMQEASFSVHTDCICTKKPKSFYSSLTFSFKSTWILECYLRAEEKVPLLFLKGSVIFLMAFLSLRTGFLKNVSTTSLPPPQAKAYYKSSCYVFLILYFLLLMVP